MTVHEKIMLYYRSLTLNVSLPVSVEVMNPYRDKITLDLCESFYSKYYDDQESRTLILGINPGRFGGGITGVPFTDPIKLELNCGLRNSLSKKPELSADFIYKMIEAFGGVEKFYKRYFIGAVCPLGFTKDGKNLNYYDQKELERAVTPFIIECLQKQLELGVNSGVCFCLGEGKNFEFLSKINTQHQFFKRIVPLPHPRFIMQYKRKKIDDFISLYVQKMAAG